MASTNFINECKNRANANRLGKIIIDGITSPITNSDNLQSFEIDSGCYTDGNIIGSVYAKCLKANFTTNQNNIVEKIIQAQIGVKYANLSNEYINMGKYKVERPNNEITANMSQITAYDELYTNLDNEYICNIDYSTGNIVLENLYVDVCNQLGLIPKTTNFINNKIPIINNPFTNKEKNRTVLQTIAKIACSFIDIDADSNKIDLCWLSNSEEPDYTFYLDDYSSVEGGEITCGPINCLIIKSSQVDDENVTIKDVESITINGEHSITIIDDYILYNAELRERAINNIWNRVKGMKYVDCKLTTYYGKPFLKLGDRIRIYINDTEYFDTYVLKHNFTYDGSFTSIIESPALTEQEIKTKQNISLGEALRNTQIIVDKQLGKITSIVDEMNTKVEDITTTTQTSTGGNSLYLKESLESNALEYGIDGKCEQETRSGKNLLDVSSVTSSQGITSVLNSNGSLSISGTASSDWANITHKNNKEIPIGSYTFSTVDVKEYPITLRVYYENKKYSNYYINAGSKSSQIILSKKVVGYYLYIWNLKADTAYNDILYLQLEEGTIQTEWEQYRASPSPDYPSEIKTIKGIRNLFNKDEFEKQLVSGKIKNDNGVEITDNTSQYSTYYIPINKNILYSFNGYFQRIYLYDKNKTWVGRILGGSGIDKMNSTYTPTIDGYIQIQIHKTTYDNNKGNEMITKGSIAHDYVPYGNWLVEKITGKNLFNIGNQSAIALNVTTEYNGSEYTLNGTTNNNGNLFSTLGSKSNYRYLGKYKSGIYHIKNHISGSVTVPTGKDFATYIRDASNNVVLNMNQNKIIDNDFTITNDTELYIQMYTNAANVVFDNFNVKLQIEQGSTATEYEPYKEKEVLIDLAKENLCNISKWQPYQYSNSLPVSISSNITINSSNNNNINFTINNNLYLYVLSNVFELEPNTTYTISYNRTNSQNITSRYYIYAYENDTYSHITNGTDDNVGKTIIFTTSASGKIAIAFGADNKANNTTCDISNIKIYKGTNADDSYELNSIGDTKDKLEIVNGVADIQKRIGKIVLNGSEDWSSYIHTSGTILYRIYLKPMKLDDSNIIVMSNYARAVANNDWTANRTDNIVFGGDDGKLQFIIPSITTVADFKSWLKSNPVTVYYILNEPETITLPNTNIPLYEGVNHVTLVEDLETTTSIKYLRKTPISGEYALNQDLNKTNSNLADINNQLSQTQSDIDNTKTNLNNNYYNKEQVDSINSTTTQNITQIRNTMEQNITSTNASISKIQEEITNGVSKVTTTTGTFDENGLNISKSGQQMSSTLDWDGLEVVRDKGKAAETEVLTVRSAGVEAENMTVRKFLIKKPIRIEKCKSITDSTKVGLGFFWIGE